MFEIEEINVATPAGNWIYRTSEAPPQLSTFVKSFWEYVGDTPAGFHKIVPNGFARIILNLGDDKGYIKSTGRNTALYANACIAESAYEHVVKKSWVSGLFDQPLLIAPTNNTDRKNTHLVAADLHPWALFMLSSAPVEEYNNKVVEFGDIVGPHIRYIREYVAEKTTPKERFLAFAQYLSGLRERSRRHLPVKTLWAIKNISQREGAVRIGALCDELDITRKHLATLFKNATGLTPKKYARLMKFKSATEAIESFKFRSDSDLAHALGYTDQSHFIKEFSDFAGETPANYRLSVNKD